MKIVSPALLLCLSVWALPSLATPDFIWRGDFETGNLSQWDYLTNPVGIRLQDDCVLEGQWAGKISITGGEEFLWHHKEELNRSEFNFKPENTAEGDDTFLGWSFYLPKTLSNHPHELGYWESDKSWTQQMRFNITGTTLSFQKSDAQQPFWQKPGFASPKLWHDIATHIHWSTDPQKGFVDVWLDGQHAGKSQLQTLVDNQHRMFTQIGLLRHREDTRETILIDNARQGHNMQDVLSGFPSTPATCQKRKATQ